MRGQTFKQGAQAAVPTALGYIGIGLACGIMAAPYMNPLEMGLMSILVYAGSAQFAMIWFICPAGACIGHRTDCFSHQYPASFALSACINSFRKSSLAQNIVIGSFLTDESYGVLMGEQVHTEEIAAS